MAPLTRRTGEPRLAAAASWAVLAASFGLSASTWIALADLAGFTDRIGWFRLAWLMPVAVDGYVVVALVLWMAPVPAAVAKFARANTYAAASIGVAAQSAFHAFLIHDQTGSWWRTTLAALVGALPPAGAALSVHMRALIRRESRAADPDVKSDVKSDTEPVPEPVYRQVKAPVKLDVNTDAEPARPVTKPAPKRPFVTTQRAAAAMQADGMEVPEIANALGITEASARRALRPARVTEDVHAGTVPAR
jgi:hypothetical protein